MFSLMAWTSTVAPVARGARDCKGCAPPQSWSACLVAAWMIYTFCHLQGAWTHLTFGDSLPRQGC